MPIVKKLLQECEDLIARGRPEEVVKTLLAEKEHTGYRSDVVALSARWQILLDEEIDAILSNDEVSRKRRRFNKDALRLLAGMDREADGVKATGSILSHAPPIGNREFSFKVMVFTTLIVAGIAAALVWAFNYQPPIDCSDQLNLSGTWEVAFSIKDSLKGTGTVNITQDDCEKDFLLSGQIEDIGGKEGVDFTARIGGIHEGEILFFYQNFFGERGVCQGVTPALGSKRFSVRCIDLYGFDKDGEPISRLVFTKADG
ncbi:MAG: hypothetical protein ACJATN_002966 [Neolewinella sp.]|jgi:hypothetical protein